MGKPEMVVFISGLVKDKKEKDDPERTVFKNKDGYLEYVAKYSLFYDFGQVWSEVIKNEIDNISKEYKSIRSIKFQQV